MLAFINGLYSDDCAGLSTVRIGRVEVEDGVGMEGAMALGLSFLVLVPCLFRESDVKSASLEAKTKMSLTFVSHQNEC